MRLKVHMSPLGSGLSVDETVDLYCGEGEQILQWVGYSACSRLAYRRGDVYGRYVPQSVLNKDGQPQDIDIVVNEIFGDGDELYVEFSDGPQPYRVRWEGRPRTPPFRWGDGVELLPPHDTWLTELDLKAEGALALVDQDLVRQDPAAVERDLEKAKQVLIQYAGAVQMMFLLQSSDGSASGDQLGQITLPQFRAIMQAAKVITSRFPPERVDEIFTGVATSEQTLARKMENKSGVSTFDLMDFFIALVHVAAHRYAAENPSQAAVNHLSLKVTALFRESFAVVAFPDMTRKLERFAPALNNSNALLLLRKGRKLTEQTLDSCQLKRSRTNVVKVDLRWLCNHFTKWGMLGRDFSLQDIAVIAVFAKQRSTDPEAFALHPQPLEYDYNEFEKLLLGIAWHIYLSRGKKATAGGVAQDVQFEEFLGETLDTVYKKAGVLVAVAQEEESEEGGEDDDDDG